MTKSSTLFLAFCCFCAPGSFAAAQTAAPEQEAVPANGGGRVLYFTSLRVRFGLAQAIEGAALRLRRPECRRVFSDFKDASENLLETNLIRFAVDPADYLLKFIWFADGSQQSQCWGMTAAFTEPGSRVVFVCGRHFEKTSREAELQIIHEILHTLGLDENPPSSDVITRQVAARCGVANEGHSGKRTIQHSPGSTTSSGGLMNDAVSTAGVVARAGRESSGGKRDHEAGPDVMPLGVERAAGECVTQPRWD